MTAEAAAPPTSSVAAADIPAADIPAVVARLRKTFATGRTRDVAWRKRQLEALERMVTENEPAIADALAQDLGRKPFESWLADIVTSLLAARLSRQDEYEADAYAAALLTKAGIGTAPQISLFRKLMAMGAASGPAWLTSHPATRERIAAIEHLTANWAQPG